MFQGPSEKKLQLFRILLSYVLYNPAVGYCQGICASPIAILYWDPNHISLVLTRVSFTGVEGGEEFTTF